MHGVVLVIVVVAIGIATFAFRQGIRLYGRKKRGDGNAGFWTANLFRKNVERDG